MKKILAVLMALMLAFGCLAICASADVAEIETEYKVGDIVTLGSYPQSKVEDAELINNLQGQISSLNYDTDWVSYGYYSNNPSFDLIEARTWSDGKMTNKDYTWAENDDYTVSGSFMKYVDVEYNGEMYRAVKIQGALIRDGVYTPYAYYRPTNTGLEATVANSLQSKNGFTATATYWFKYEPLKWEILDAETGLAVCTTIVDSQPFNNICYRGTDYNGDSFIVPESEDGTYNGTGAYYSTYNYYNDSPFQQPEKDGLAGLIETVKPYLGLGTPTNKSEEYNHTLASDYAGSSIRTWLTSNFFNTAFNDTEKAEIASTTISNKGYYTLTGDYAHGALDSANTKDQIFLLGYDEIGKYFNEKNILAAGTSYASIQGLKSGDSSAYFLRSAGKLSCLACTVSADGTPTDGNRINDTYIGIRPAIKLGESEVEEEETDFFTGAMNAIRDFFVRIGDWFKELFA